MLLGQDSSCSPGAVPADPSLYCLPLLSTQAAPLASGIATLHPAPGPFAVAVTREGRPRFGVKLVLSGLPEPSTLGYREFVAWATTPELEPMLRLGRVRNGQTAIGSIDLERFVIMVSAESSATVPRRSGPLVLRGSSPSLMMLPHGTSALPPQSPAPHHHDAGGAWSMPPHHPLASRMPSGLERFQPDVAPFLPATDSTLLQDAEATRVYHLANGDTLTLTAMKVRRAHPGHAHVMYAYDGQIWPMPTTGCRA
jgi:hypothetical protein